MTGFQNVPDNLRRPFFLSFILGVSEDGRHCALPFVVDSRYCIEM